MTCITLKKYETALNFSKVSIHKLKEKLLKKKKIIVTAAFSGFFNIARSDRLLFCVSKFI